jgi:hypothetical protein
MVYLPECILHFLHSYCAVCAVKFIKHILEPVPYASLVLSPPSFTTRVRSRDVTEVAFPLPCATGNDFLLMIFKLVIHPALSTVLKKSIRMQ